jgi:hypothetical protein
MGTVNLEDVAGLRLENEIVCRRCCTGEEERTFTEDQVITEEETQGDLLYFCDRCRERF